MSFLGAWDDGGPLAKARKNGSVLKSKSSSVMELEHSEIYADKKNEFKPKLCPSTWTRARQSTGDSPVKLGSEHSACQLAMGKRL